MGCLRLILAFLLNEPLLLQSSRVFYFVESSAGILLGLWLVLIRRLTLLLIRVDAWAVVHEVTLRLNMRLLLLLLLLAGLLSLHQSGFFVEELLLELPGKCFVIHLHPFYLVR